jgi:hypothetical protein
LVVPVCWDYYLSGILLSEVSEKYPEKLEELKELGWSEAEK